MVSPSHKKEAVEHVVRQRLCSVRRACRYLGWSRSSYRYHPRPSTDRQQQLQQRIVTLSWQYPRYGYRRIRAVLVGEGWTVSRKQV
jgi:putative transposase